MMNLTPQQAAQAKANLVDLHSMLGVYEDYIRNTGYVEPPAGAQGEQEAIRTLCMGIEKRVEVLKKQHPSV